MLGKFIVTVAGNSFSACVLITSGVLITNPGGVHFVGSPTEIRKNPIRQEIVDSAYEFIGVRYKWGGDTMNGVDCSGLVKAVYSRNGISIPRTSREQFDYNGGRAITKEELQPGDLVFFATLDSATVSHVGIFIGNNQVIHAPGLASIVKISDLNIPYFSKTYVGAKSFVSDLFNFSIVENNTLYSFSERGVASSNYTTDIGEFKAAPEFLGRAALAAIRYESKIIAAGVEHSEGIYLVAKNLSAEEISILLKENIRKAINFVQQFL